MGGHDRESLPSNQAWATVVDENEVQKRLGLQDYWSYRALRQAVGMDISMFPMEMFRISAQT